MDNIFINDYVYCFRITIKSRYHVIIINHRAIINLKKVNFLITQNLHILKITNM